MDMLGEILAAINVVIGLVDLILHFKDRADK